MVETDGLSKLWFSTKGDSRHALNQPLGMKHLVRIETPGVRLMGSYTGSVSLGTLHSLSLTSSLQTEDDTCLIGLLI